MATLDNSYSISVVTNTPTGTFSTTVSTTAVEQLLPTNYELKPDPIGVFYGKLP